jgi:peptidylprolyl isomerase
MSKATLTAWIIFLAGVALVVLYYFMTVPGSAPKVVNDAPGQAGGPQIEITVAGEANGRVVIELFDTLAPQHAERIDGFMAQTGDVEFGKAGGDMRMAGTGGSSYPDLPLEASKESFVAGAVGMARSADPNSANSQFFIMFAPAPHLDGDYTVVGRVIEGMDVVNAIKRGTGGNGAVIGEPDVMETVRVIE